MSWHKIDVFWFFNASRDNSGLNVILGERNAEHSFHTLQKCRPGWILVTRHPSYNLKNSVYVLTQLKPFIKKSDSSVNNTLAGEHHCMLKNHFH